MNTRSLAISAGAGGIIMGGLSAMPLVNLANCILCLWLWVGGGLAVFIYTRLEPGPVSSGQGASIGAIAGVVGALLLSGLTLLLGGMATALTALDSTTTDEVLMMAGIQGLNSLITLAVYLVFCPGFGALAGLIGAELFGKPDRPVGLG